MKTNQIIALVIGIIGLIVMFFFPEPETNFIYYIGWGVIIGFLVIWVLKKKK